jgi:hypothetical protein
MKRLLLVVLLLALPGCTTNQIMSGGEMAAVAPMLSVERFLKASNERDLHSMASIFGTADGPIIDTGGAFGCAFKKMGSWIGLGDACQSLQEVELRMDLISDLLRHDDYTIASDALVAGRVNPTTRIGVHMVIRGRDISDVPFLVVKTDGGRWLVQEIGLEKVMG